VTTLVALGEPSRISSAQIQPDPAFAVLNRAVTLPSLYVRRDFVNFVPAELFDVLAVFHISQSHLSHYLLIRAYDDRRLFLVRRIGQDVVVESDS
jgi:hypothetical protein